MRGCSSPCLINHVVCDTWPVWHQTYGYLPSLYRYQIYKRLNSVDLTSHTGPGSNPGRYTDQASVHVFSLAVAHATAMLIRQFSNWWHFINDKNSAVRRWLWVLIVQQIFPMQLHSKNMLCSWDKHIKVCAYCNTKVLTIQCDTKLIHPTLNGIFPVSRVQVIE